MMAKVPKERTREEAKEREMVEKDEAKETKGTKVARVKTKAKTRVKRVRAKVVNLKPLATRDASMPRVGKNFAGCSKPSTMATRSATIKMLLGQI